MTRLADRTAAVMVSYRGEGVAEAVLQELRQAVAHVVLVDNAEAPREPLREAAARSHCALIQAGNVGGLAGAYNRAIVHLRSERPEISHVVFLDEDSDVASLDRFLSDGQVERLLDRPDTAAVAPAYRDRATGLRGKYIELRRFGLRYLSRQFSDVRAVAFVINSMSVWRMAALQQIGRFHEGLAIDHVDTEYCLRARRAGLAVYVHGAHEFAHSIGQRRKYRLLGRELQAGGHPPARRYLIGRNTSWLARTWLVREPAFAALCVARLAYEVVGIVIAEDQAGAKLGALLRGAFSGLWRRLPA